MHDSTATADLESADDLPVIRARVDPRLLRKADRLLTGTLEGRIIELLQNARRAGAQHVEITNSGGTVTIQDDGRGIDDFAKLLDLGGSGWEEEYEASEDPAGVGLFCLAPRDIRIRSKGRRVDITSGGWRGAPVEVLPDHGPAQGTIVQFEDDEWSAALVRPLAAFGGMKVAVDDRPLPREDFLGKNAVHHPELGCRIEVLASNDERKCGAQFCGRDAYCRNAAINFHGQLVHFDYHEVDEPGLHYLIDLTGEPTGIRLMLPARTQLVENPARGALLAAIELEAYWFLKHAGHHKLPYKQYVRARELGVDLPEADPQFSVGLLSDSDNGTYPGLVKQPSGFPLSSCYRFEYEADSDHETDVCNAHILAVLGEFKTPFVPVEIQPKYDGYSWATLPTIGSVAVEIGRKTHEASVWRGTLTCVESLVITVKTSDGRVFRSAVCMAVPPGVDEREDLLVTPAAQREADDTVLWFYMGGPFDDDDTWDTQSDRFSSELHDFGLALVGPEESARRGVLSAIEQIRGVGNWRFVKVWPDGRVEITSKRGKKKMLKPPKRG